MDVRTRRLTLVSCPNQGGDAVWEGLRVYDGRVFKFAEHLQRLVDSAKAMDFKGELNPTPQCQRGQIQAPLAQGRVL